MADYLRAITPIDRSDFQDATRHQQRPSHPDLQTCLHGGDVPSVRHPQPFRFQPDASEQALRDDDYSRKPTIAQAVGWILMWTCAGGMIWLLFAVGRWLMR